MMYGLSNHTFEDRAKQFSVSIDNLIIRMKQIMKPKRECNICGSHEFKAGPLGRLTVAGEMPHCVE